MIRGNHDRRLSRMLTALCAVMAVLVTMTFADVPVKKGGCYIPPPPKPAQASGAEGLPPLPLPAVPLRRTEKKNPPKPPVLVAKIDTGINGDWNTDPNDINNLLNWMKAQLGVNFSTEAKKLGEINLESGQVPVIYHTGHEPFQYTPEQRQRLRNYALGGGMLLYENCWGLGKFPPCVRSELAQMFPEYPLKKLPLDHPIYNSFYENAGVVEFTAFTKRPRGSAELEGIEIGCRLIAVFSPHDMSCGWDMHTNEIEGGSWIESEYALRLGANIVAYATANRDMGAAITDSKSFVDADAKKTDKFRVGQIVHDGDWNPDPRGLQNLLDIAARDTALKISFETVAVQPTFAELSKYPFVYMTGHDDFTWNENQVAAVRQYLANGGFIFADSCCGRQKFDIAFRREMARVLGTDEPFALLTPRHPIYSIHHQIATVDLTEAAMRRAGADNRALPRLEGAALNGRLAVVYSPLALNVGWRVKPVSYAVGYAPASALQLGTNVIIYAMTQ